MKLLDPRSYFATLFFFLICGACAQIADFSLEAYKNATSIKARSLNLIEVSTNSYASQKQKAEQLLLDIDVAYEFSAGFENNSEATEMWDIIRDGDENLMGGFVAFWRDRSPSGVSPDFAENFRDEVVFAFDRLICLEANKEAPTSCNEAQTR